MQNEPARKRSILVVEDEVLIAMEIRDRLTHLGFKVVGVAGSGEAAVNAAGQSRPDLILMDIRLKGEMDGIEAARQIRDSLNIPVVYLTAHSDSATLRRAKETAPFGYVLKPFQERDLLVAIEMASHRHSLEQRLKESEQKYAATLASIGDGVVATDADGRITFLNAVAEALTGWSLADAAGVAVEQVLSLIHEKDRTIIDNPASQALRERRKVELADPALLVSRTGDLIPVDDCAAPIKTDRGDVIGCVVAFRDIRQRRLAENALRKAEEELRQALKMEAIGRLAGGVAHDFNNLLTVINGYCSLLLETGRLDKRSAGQVELILNAAERAAGLTKQLLAFGRKQMLKKEVVDLNVIAAGMGNLLRRLIGEDIHLTTTLSPGLRKVLADPSQIEQVIMNLAVNARDAMPHGGRLMIETSNVDFSEAVVEDRPEIKPGAYVMLAVSDTGSGFDDTVKANLFEPFFTTKELGKGSGLGLATVYGIVKQSEGFIYAYSEPGHGASFKIYLPSIEHKGDEPATSESSVGDKSLARGGETILLVEDEDAVRAVSASVLKDLGYSVLEARDAAEALDMSQQFSGKIDLLVTDVVMPKMSGTQLAQQLGPLRSDTRVLYVSGYTDDSVLRRGILYNAVNFLQKPFTPTALAAKVREILDR